jgi:predicted HD phosphohydrolase
MWQNIQFTEEEEAIIDAYWEEVAAAGGVDKLPKIPEHEAAVAAAWARLHADNELARRAWDQRASRASRRRRMVLDAVRRSAYLR